MQLLQIITKPISGFKDCLTKFPMAGVHVISRIVRINFETLR